VAKARAGIEKQLSPDDLKRAKTPAKPRIRDSRRPDPIGRSAAYNLLDKTSAVPHD